MKSIDQRRLSPVFAFLLAGLTLAALMVGLLLILGPPPVQAQSSVASVGAVPPPLPVNQSLCGNKRCDTNLGEDCNTCSVDCGPCQPPPDPCGDGQCDPTTGETCDTCSADCGSCPDQGFCGNEELDPGEACDGAGFDGGNCGPGTTCIRCQCVPGICGDFTHDSSLGEECDGGGCPDGVTCNQQTCTCDTTGTQPRCGDGVINQASEQCDGAALGQCTSCTASCTCGGTSTQPRCGDGVINQPSEQCDGTALGQCTTCTASCTCGGIGPTCGDNVVNQAFEICDGSDASACAADGTICTNDCACEPGDPCEPVDEGDGGPSNGGSTPGQPGATNGDSNGVAIAVFARNGDGDGGGNGGATLTVGGIGDSSTRREDCEEGDCITPGAGVINTMGGSADIPAVECCNADGTGCVLHVAGSVTWYTAPDGSVQLCSSDFDSYCRPVPGDRCRPTRTDDLSGGGGERIYRTIADMDGAASEAQASPGHLASTAPQQTMRQIYGYVCDDPSELCIDLEDARQFQQTLSQPGYPTPYDGVVLWDCQVPDESETAIAIANNAFPQVITIPIFTEITWTNTDQGAHSVTSDDGLFDSGALAQGQSFTHDFNLFGEFPYHSEGEPGMTGLIRVVPLCEQKKLEVKPDGRRACAQCFGDWCGFATGRPECVLVPHNDMPDLWQTRYAVVEGIASQDLGDLSDDVWALICPAPPTGHVCIPIDARMRTLSESGDLIGLTDCFTGDVGDDSVCPVLAQDFALETGPNGQNYLCFDAGEQTAFEPSCGPHPDLPVNGCAFSVQGGTGAGVVSTGGAVPSLEGPQGLPPWLADSAVGRLLPDFPAWLVYVIIALAVLLVVGLFLLVVVNLLGMLRRGGE